jgi:sortase A
LVGACSNASAQTHVVRTSPAQATSTVTQPILSTELSTDPPTTTTLPPTTIAAATTTPVPATSLDPSDAPVSQVPDAPPDPNAPAIDTPLATIEIPSIGVTKTMYEGVQLAVLDHGPGHWPGSAMPGQLGNLVVAGHRMSHDHPFRDLDQLVPGDEMIITTAATRFVYRVSGTEIVTPDSVWITAPTPDATATLFACHPKGSTRQRIVVHLSLDPSASV